LLFIAMNKVTVVTDSGAHLSQELADKYGIYVIPVRITVEGKVYRDTNEDLPLEVVHKFQKLAQIDTTPWPPTVYCEAYKEAGQRANKVVHVGGSSQFTSTISSAKTGAKMAEQAMPGLQVEVFDAELFAMAPGFIALAAARAAAKSNDMSEVIEAASNVKARVKQFFVLNTFSHLKRTGRVDKLAEWSSSMLRARPMINFSPGRVEPVSLLRTKSQIMKNLIKAMQDNVDNTQPLYVAVTYSEQSQEAEELIKAIAEQFHPVELYHMPFNPAGQAVGGPGILGITFYQGD
jgi:DegV family protein with EDD domain